MIIPVCFFRKPDFRQDAVKHDKIDIHYLNPDSFYCWHLEKISLNGKDRPSLHSLGHVSFYSDPGKEATLYSLHPLNKRPGRGKFHRYACIILM